MRRASLRTLALLLTLTLLAQLFPLAALADAPSFSNLYDACDYLRTCMEDVYKRQAKRRPSPFRLKLWS